MIVIPCSMKTLSAIASGYAANLLTRAADVTLKEGRKLVLVPREMPLGKVHLRNMSAAADLGAAIVPPMLTFYNDPAGLEDQITHVIGKCLALFGLEVPGFREWKGDAGA
jgi:4-hydroxy-3-polyprenylbenzoate decarboxylase